MYTLSDLSRIINRCQEHLKEADNHKMSDDSYKKYKDYVRRDYPDLLNVARHYEVLLKELNRDEPVNKTAE